MFVELLLCARNKYRHQGCVRAQPVKENRDKDLFLLGSLIDTIISKLYGILEIIIVINMEKNRTG